MRGSSRQPHKCGLDIFNLLLVNHKPRRQLDPELGVADPIVLTRLAMDAFTCQIKHINPSRQRGDGKTGWGVVLPLRSRGRVS